MVETAADIPPDNAESFGFFLPVDIVKSDTGERIIQGIASTPSKDLQGESVVQRGIDYDYFLKFGYINDDHQQGPEHKVGEPVACKITKDGFWLRARLYKGKSRSEHWWEHIQTLQRENSNRRVGFSIEGKVLRRDPNDSSVIVKCWLRDVAITASPVNTNTWAEISKSLNAAKWCACDGGKSRCRCSDTKAMTAAGIGKPLIPQSLEGLPKNMTRDDSYKFFRSNGFSDKQASLMTAAIFART